MQYTQLCLLVTDRCNAECAFCGPRCGRSRTNVMTEELGRSALEQAKAFGSFALVGISGGEAFLYPELSASLLDYAKELGFPQRTLTTNGFWGGWTDEKIEWVLDSLASVTVVGFSYDAFHAEWIPKRSFWRAVNAVQRRGIPCVINVADVPGEKGAGPFLTAQGDEALSRRYSLYRLIRAGRAKEMSADNFFPDVDTEKSGCSFRGDVVVSCDGSVYPCCSSGIQGTRFILGNLNESSLSDILLHTPAAKLRDVLRLQPCFARLIAAAREEWGVEIPDKVVNGCEACQAAFAEEENVKRAEARADEMRRELLMEHLLGKARE